MAGGQSGQGMMDPQMMQMMMRMHGQMMGGGGMMGGMMDNPMFKSFDTDGDGRVSPEEMRAGQKAKLERFDENSDGSLSLDEFEALHSAAIREMMVDKFQKLDNDGDGQVTSEEMAAPARKMERMQKMRAQSGQKHPGAMMGGDTETSEENN
ncbi:EF-hand domain-containing protein [Rhodobacteraceae bacterium M382]|nr:EF-hand domain-containing protein [Rhodobacteraceae bacterium M382]UWQ93427.1 EF-hand domain-containing protein [Rhodobacteraceae bacterium M382]